MIYLHTGLPGAGKTLYTIDWVRREWPDRAVFYSGIKDLKLGWMKLPSWERGDRVAADWVEVPDGAVVVIDEAQHTFRPRAPGAKVPEHVAALETHRHRGLDIVMITQHPKLLDANVRRLCGCYKHIVRRFGGHSAVVHEWMEVKEDPERSRQDSIRKEWAYPKELFGVYHSAEVHTHKRRIPWRVFVAWGAPVLALLCLGGGIYLSVRSVLDREDTIVAKAGGNGVVPGSNENRGGQVGAVGPGVSQPTFEQVQVEYLRSFVPLIPGLPHTAPAYAELTKPKQVPDPAACVLAEEKEVRGIARGCRCYTRQATLLPDVPEELCRQIVAHGYFRAWEEEPRFVSDGRGGGRVDAIEGRAALADVQSLPAVLRAEPRRVEAVQAR